MLLLNFDLKGARDSRLNVARDANFIGRTASARRSRPTWLQGWRVRYTI